MGVAHQHLDFAGRNAAPPTFAGLMAENAGCPWTLSTCVCVRPSGQELDRAERPTNSVESRYVSKQSFTESRRLNYPGNQVAPRRLRSRE
jgi:hypothetical protein